MPDGAAAMVRNDLRNGDSALLQRRRAVVGLSIFSTAVLGAVALFQVGVLRKLPNPPLPHFDAERVNGSTEAYSKLRTPDALLGMASYAATACLAGMGSESRWRETPLVPLAMTAKTAVDAALAAKLSLEQWTKFRSFSLPSMLVAGATFAAFPFAIAEAKRAWRA